MKIRLFFGVCGLCASTLASSNAQSPSAGAAPAAPPAPSAGVLPPGVQNMQQLPPGLRNRQELLKRFPQMSTSGTNPFDQFTNSTSLTNQIGLSNQTGLTLQDRAVTATDRALLIRLRATVGSIVESPGQASIQSQVQPSIQSQAQTTIQSPGQSSVQFPGGPWMPVHFNADNGVVTLLGNVASQQQQQQIASLVAQTPGVAQVVDQLRVGANGQATGQITSTSGQALLLRVRQSVLPQIQVGGAPVPVNFAMQQEGVVTITGVVTSLAQKHQIAALVTQVPGVVQIDDRMAVNPAAASNPGLNTATGFPQAGFPGNTGTAGVSNGTGTGTFLSPTGRTNSEVLPPGLENRTVLPPGLQQREQLPPGLLNRTNTQTPGGQ